MPTAETVIVACVTILLVVVLISLLGWYSTRPPTPAQLRARLEKDLSELQDEFLKAGGRSGKPRGLRWVRCDWGTETALARDRTSGETVALLAVAITFEPEPGAEADGELAHPDAARTASAVFFYLAGRWQTVGKAVFNLDPAEVLKQFADQYEPLNG